MSKKISTPCINIDGMRKIADYLKHYSNASAWAFSSVVQT